MMFADSVAFRVKFCKEFERCTQTKFTDAQVILDFFQKKHIRNQEKQEAAKLFQCETYKILITFSW